MRFASALLITILTLPMPLTARADSKPKSFTMGDVAVTAQPPAGWVENEGEPPSFFDADGKKGSIAFVGTPMAGVDDATMKMMHKAALEANNNRLKAGELIKNEERAVDGFNGILTVEAAKDPSMRRMQWVAYGHGGFYTVMMASPGEPFEAYLPTFEAFLGSLKLTPTKK
jgi:hypothetical protein